MRNILPIILVTLLLSFSTDTHPLDIVIANQTDENTKKKLSTFREEGIELPLEFEDGDTTSSDMGSRVDLEKIISTAESFLGTKHQMGGTSRKGIDCSGMVMMSLRSCGILAPHNSHGQARYGNIIPAMDSIKRGDLVFFINSFKSSYLITHSGICIGDHKFIHASASSGVIITELSAPYWKTKFIFGTRIK